MLIVDGYNLMFINEKGKSKIKDIEKAREHLLILLSKYYLRKGTFITVVFDSGASGFKYGLKRKLEKLGLEIIFTPKDSSADDYIVEIVNKSKNPEGIKVITSDHHIKDEIEKCNAKSISSREFMKEILQTIATEQDFDIEYYAKEHGISEREVGYWMRQFGIKDK